MFHVVSSDSDQLKSACLDNVRGMLKAFWLPSNCNVVAVGNPSQSKKPTTLLMLNLPPEDRAWRLKMVRLVDWVRTEYLEKRRSVIFVYRHKRARNVFEYLLDEEDLKLYPPDGWI